VRLTNWDALQLASGVSKGTSVDFIGEPLHAFNGRWEREYLQVIWMWSTAFHGS
jgi:hypothetical protein